MSLILILTATIVPPPGAGDKRQRAAQRAGPLAHAAQAEGLRLERGRPG
jgi:hypothetical protein